MPDNEVLDRLERMLEKQRKQSIERGSTSIVFEGSMWPNLRATVIYDQGYLWIDRQQGESRLRYDFRSLHAFVFCLLGAAMFFALGSMGGDLVQGLTVAAVAFGWVYGMNLVLALTCVPVLIRLTVRMD